MVSELVSGSIWPGFILAFLNRHRGDRRPSPPPPGHQWCDKSRIYNLYGRHRPPARSEQYGILIAVHPYLPGQAESGLRTPP